MGEIVNLTVVPGENYHAEADQILDSAKGQLTHCVIVGRDADGNIYIGQTHGKADTVYLLAQAQHDLLEDRDED